jgi:multiple sugar transport system permease protein
MSEMSVTEGLEGRRRPSSPPAPQIEEPRFPIRWPIARLLGRLRLPRSVVLLALILLAPALLLRIVTSVYPFIATAWTSFTNSSAYVAQAQFVGFDNYARILQNPSSQGALIFSIVFAVVSTVLQVVFGFILALLLNTKFRFQNFTRAVVLLPWAIPAIVAALGFRFMFSAESGLIAVALSAFGIEVSWLSDPLAAQVAVIVANVWRSIPFIAFVVLAGLQGVPHELIEAARVDGAGRLRITMQILVPLMMPLLITMGTFMVIFQIGSFDIIYGMTGGGPGSATQVAPYLAYQSAFISLKYGESAAISMLLFLIILAIGVLALARFRKAQVEF